MKVSFRPTSLIVGLALIFQFTGCESKTPPPQGFTRGNLPDKIEHLPFGKMSYITAKALVDSLNSGVKMHIYFLQDFTYEIPELVVQLPGMISLFAGDVTNQVKKLPPGTPVYIVCPYGDDSKNIAKLVIKEGYDCYYLDGGTYRLTTEMRKNGWIIKSQ
ncbi:MAG: rhodanese-like domain-containing protein [Calditrichaeota bacterium]|nr:rhodanese-like domain-containing protein [Calditrichota bacterium]